MKQLIFTLSLLCFIATQSNAQYCGGSGPSICTPIVLSQPGLSPVSNNLNPIVDSIPTTVNIEFQNYDTLSFNGLHLTMDSLTVDSINNLPTGYCWATNKVTNTFGNQENGCIRVTGNTTAHPGQYKLNIIVIAYTSIGTPLTTTADAAGLHYYVRVICDSNATYPPVDTTQTAANPFIPYNSGCPFHGVGIEDVTANIQSLNVYPNPFNTQTVVTFNSLKSGMMTEKITNIIGSIVYSKPIEVATGENSHAIQRGSLAAGVYFYTITDGTSSFTKKLIIAE
jgi:type IX secretion system substrate protein